MSEQPKPELTGDCSFETETESNKLTAIESDIVNNLDHQAEPATIGTGQAKNLPRLSQSSSTTPQLSLEQQLNKSKRDLESMVIKYARSESENLQNKNKIDELDKKLKRVVKDNEGLANRIKILTNDKNSITDVLNAKIAQLTVLEQRNNSLTDEQTARLRELEEKCTQLEKTNEDLLKQIETHKNKEGELLDFSERLSMKQMLLQTELDKALENMPDYKVRYEKEKQDNVELRKSYQECLEKIDKLTGELSEERSNIAQLIEEKAELELKSRRIIDELENEMKVMRRKHQIAIKETYKQMKLVNGTGTSNTQGQKQQIIKS